MSLTSGTVDHLAAIDRVLEEASKNWRLDRMPVIDRLILRMGIYELMFETDTPPAVVIDEALELARRFSTDDAVPFINGVLDAVKGRVRARRVACRPRAIMTLLDDQIQQRRANLEALEALGIDVYPRRFDRTHTDLGAGQRIRRPRGRGPRRRQGRDRHRGPRPGHPQLRQGELSGAVRRLAAPPGLRASGRAARAATSRSSSCSISAITSASKGTCSARAPASSVSGRGAWCSSPSATCRCPRSGTASRTSRRAIGSGTST